MLKTNLVIGFLLIIVLAMSASLFAQNNALDFDGTNDYVNISGLSTDGFSGLTIEAWVYAHSFNTSGSPDNNISEIAGKEETSLLRIGDEASGELVENDKAQFVITTSAGTKKCSGTSDLALNTWYHIAGTYDGTNKRLYVNGVLEKTVAHSGNIVSSAGQQIGGTIGQRYFDGMIDEVRIWNDARTEIEIRGNMYQELAGTEDNLVAYYKLNETAGTTANDNQSSGTHDGTLTDMSGDEWETSPAFFGPKNALTFSDDYVTIGSFFACDGKSESGECWVNLPSTSEKGAFVHVGNNDDGYGIGVGSGADAGSWDALGNTLVLLYDKIRWINTNTTIGTGWHHVAYTIDASGRATAFLDGITVYSETGEQLAPITPSGNSSIGSSQTTTRMLSSGTIDEVRLWGDIRTEAEIRENMCKTLTGNEGDLLAYYNCDNGTGTELLNFARAYGADDGTITDAVWTSSTAFNTWLNTSSSSWTTTSNWSRGSAPVSTDNVGIVDYTGGTSPSLSGTPSVNNMVIGSTSDLTLSSNATINGNLFLYDDLDLNGQTITLGSTAHLYEAGGNISGTSGTIQTTRNLNNIDEDVAGLGAEITTSSDMGSTTIIRSHEAQGSQGIERYYQISTTNSPSNDTLVFHYDDSELNGQTEAELKLFKSSDGSTWAEQSSSTVNTTNNTLTLTGINAFSYWTAAPTGSDASLPVEISSFTAENRSGVVLLKWATESEIENLGFIIGKRNPENGDWMEIANYLTDTALEGHGSTTEAHEYQFTDKAVEPGVTYEYRLGDVDYNGKVTWHGKVEIKVEAESVKIPAEFGLQKAYPNPFNPATTISYQLGSASFVKISIYDVRGNLVETLVNEQKDRGSYSVILDAGGLSSGIYIYKITAGKYSSINKCLLIR